MPLKRGMSLRGGALLPTLAPYASAVSNLIHNVGDCFGTKNKSVPRNDIKVLSKIPSRFYPLVSL
jgi:hypothetical protein